VAAAARVLAAWQDWAPDGPDELAASLVVTAARDPERPAVASVFGALSGSAGDLAPLLDDLVARVGSDPQWTCHEEAAYRAAKARLSELGATGHGPEDADEGHAYSTSSYVGGRLTEATVAALVERFTAGRVAGQARELDLSPWGGAYGRVPPDATAFVHRGDRFLLKQTATVTATAADGERDAARRWLAASTDVVRPAASGRSYQNFPDPELPDPAAAYYGGNVPRLRRIKHRYDPERLFRRGTAL
jgi:FAD/FMN-containing dehydrogenase